MSEKACDEKNALAYFDKRQRRRKTAIFFSLRQQMEASLHVIGNTLPLIKMIAQKQLIRPAVSQKVYNIEIIDL
jgi:hypothetical protein